ncbi:MAG: DUF45 domain-containing protein [Clostridia bacterium]|nr:DUF45 domain-containing protein [Clostridia bacterium]
MKKTLLLQDGTSISYEIRVKPVKNLNLHLENDGTVWVSANQRHLEKEIEEFVCSKTGWITRHLAGIKMRTPPTRYFSEEALAETVRLYCDKLFPYYETKGISYPKIKFRKMTSQWGNCRPKQGILTFNKNLCFVSKECVWYVVCHEWTHFLVPNHSEAFYRELEKICADYQEIRKQLKGVYIQ